MVYLTKEDQKHIEKHSEGIVRRVEEILADSSLDIRHLFSDHKLLVEIGVRPDSNYDGDKRDEGSILYRLPKNILAIIVGTKDSKSSRVQELRRNLRPIPDSDNEQVQYKFDVGAL